MTKEQMIDILTGGKHYENLDECIAELTEIAEWIKSAENVVRCKDCENRKYCEIRWSVDGDWFCADGESKMEDENDGQND